MALRCSWMDQWSQRLCVALLYHHGITPYRQRGQRRSTVMARLRRAFVNGASGPRSRSCSKRDRRPAMP